MRYRKLNTIVAALILIVAIALPAFATDVRVTKEIQSITRAIDKNGNPYYRIIINETRNIAGVEYVTGVPVMAFSNMIGKAKEFKVGDILDAICVMREYQGRTSYTILAIIE